MGNLSLSPLHDGIDDDDAFERVLLEMLDTYRRKRNDYATEDDQFANFRSASSQVQAGPMLAVEILIAVKQARLRELMWTPGKAARNEPIEDTLLDRACYSVIALALYREETEL